MMFHAATPNLFSSEELWPSESVPTYNCTISWCKDELFTQGTITLILTLSIHIQTKCVFFLFCFFVVFFLFFYLLEVWQFRGPQTETSLLCIEESFDINSSCGCCQLCNDTCRIKWKNGLKTIRFKTDHLVKCSRFISLWNQQHHSKFPPLAEPGTLYLWNQLIFNSEYIQCLHWQTERRLGD